MSGSWSRQGRQGPRSLHDKGLVLHAWSRVLVTFSLLTRINILSQICFGMMAVHQERAMVEKREVSPKSERIMIRILIIKITLRAWAYLMIGGSSRTVRKCTVKANPSAATSLAFTHSSLHLRQPSSCQLQSVARGESPGVWSPSRGYPASSAADRMATTKMLPYIFLGAFRTWMASAAGSASVI